MKEWAGEPEVATLRVGTASAGCSVAGYTLKEGTANAGCSLEGCTFNERTATAGCSLSGLPKSFSGDPVLSAMDKEGRKINCPLPLFFRGWGGLMYQKFFPAPGMLTDVRATGARSDYLVL